MTATLSVPLFRALVGKEWRQLRLVRRAGAALCLALPALLLAGAAAWHRGWLPFGRLGSYTTREVLTEGGLAMFVVCVLLVPFVVVQGFLADRAAGTEVFLLTSPVRRRWVWSARLAASVLSILALFLFGFLVWAASTLPVGGLPEELAAGHPVEILFPIGAGEIGRALSAVDASSRGPGRTHAGLEATARRRDGSDLPVEVNLSQLEVNGQALIACVIHDANDRARVEDEQDRFFRL